MLVFVDTQIFIWGVRKYATRGQEEQVLKAEAFFKKAGEKRTTIGIAAPTISEYLIGTPQRKPQQNYSLIISYSDSEFIIKFST